MANDRAEPVRRSRTMTGDSGTNGRAAAGTRGGASRWTLALVVVLAAGLIPLLAFGPANGWSVGAANWAVLALGLLVAVFVLAGPLLGALVLANTRRLRLVAAGVLVAGLAGTYVVSQHRPDSAASPPVSDWIVPYAWVASTLCAGFAVVRRLRSRRPRLSGARDALGFAMLAFAMLYSGCVGYLFAMEDLADGRLVARPNHDAEVVIPSGWTEQDWTRIEEGTVGFSSDLRPPAGMSQDEATARLGEFLCEKRGWCTPCRPVRGILSWGRHCLSITTTPDNAELVRLSIVKEGTTPPAR
jgi:hypothetical protein